jgi:inosine-uridine nucleoside N-ribohydrolase
LLLDVDTGVDDAMAIALALELERHELIAVTTVAGNVPVDYTTPNTLKVLDWLGATTPVYRGMSAPLARPLITAGHVHGDDGIGGWTAPAAKRSIDAETAPEAIVRLARAHRGEIVFAFVGPLTNLAVSLLLEPELPELVSRLVIMGGVFFNPGNVTADAEFNIYVDPEAAALVAGAGFRATWIGLDVTHQTPLTRAVWDGLAGAEHPASVLVREVSRRAFEVRGRNGVHLHDPLAVAVVEHPELVDTRQGEIAVDVGPRHRGRTRLSVEASGWGSVAAGVDVKKFDERFGRLLDG